MQKTETIIQLIRYSKDEWGVRSYDRANTGRGSIRKAFRALRNLGIKFDAFELALKTLIETGDNVADFSVTGARVFLSSRFVNLADHAPAQEIVGHA